MAKVIDLTGLRFGRWSVCGLSHQVGTMLYWSCVCDCGTGRAVFGGDLKRGGSQSCGCLAREDRAERATKHGMALHPAYRQWIGMRGRCENPNNTGFYLYGGRGITVCERWSAFDIFWADMGPTWRKGLTIDRINSDGNYEPRNCRWATPAEQAGNRRTARIINTPNGPMSVTDAARRFGLPPETIFSRLRYGWDERKIFSTP